LKVVVHEETRAPDLYRVNVRDAGYMDKCRNQSKKALPMLGREI
jgi:hypothetical protein